MDFYIVCQRAVYYLALSNAVAAVIVLFSFGLFFICKKVFREYFDGGDSDFAFQFLTGFAIAVCLITAIGFLTGFASPVWWTILCLFTLIGTGYIYKYIIEFARIILIFNVSALFIPIGVALYGGINIFHDGFTYVSLAQWNVENPFLKHVVVENPMMTQVAMYQLLAFRMGAVNFFAALQAISGQAWSVVVYPIWLQVGVFTSAVGLYCAANALAGRSNVRFAWLVAMSLTLGPGVFYFSAQAGFIPQLYGLIGILGLSITLVRTDEKSLYAGNNTALVRSALHAGLFLSVVVVCYSEIAPMAVVISGVYFLYMLGHGIANGKVNILKLALLVAVFLITVLIFSNYQIYRAYLALILQSGAVVGWDVWWSAGSLMAFATGVKEGVGAGGTRSLGIGELLGMVFLLGLVVFFSYRRFKNGDKQPTVLAAASFFSIGLLALFVMLKAPMVDESARFQQWGFFKLSGWLAAPLGCLIVAAFSRFLALIGPLRWVVLLPFGLAVCFDFANAHQQANFYFKIGEKPIVDWVKEVRKKVESVSEVPGQCVTLRFPHVYGKFRQLASYALYPREIYADWGNDGYIVHFIDDKYKREKEDCVFLIGSATTSGVQVDAYPGRQGIPASVSYVSGEYNIETTLTESWNWVRDTVRYEVRNNGNLDAKVSLSFAFTGQKGGHLDVKVGGETKVFQFATNGELQSAEIGVDLQSGVSSVPIDFKFDGEAKALSVRDKRIVRGRLLNVRLK